MSTINLFSQILSKIDRNSFKKLVQEKQTDKHQKGCDSWTHLVSMLFCQFSKSQSVRDNIPLLAGSVIVADRYYNDFSLLRVWDSNKVFFVIRHKHNIPFKSIKENELPNNRHEHILKDELIELTGNQSKDKYPKRLRRVALYDETNDQTIELIINQMSRTANTIGELYKSRWQIEVFFREIRQTTAH